MDILIVVFVLLGPVYLLAVLKRTRMFWLPGAALLVVAVALFASMPGGGGEDLQNALASTALGVAGFGVAVYGVICLAIGRWLHRRSTPAVELPPATVVSSVSKT